jgi:hypothetical protein
MSVPATRVSLCKRSKAPTISGTTIKRTTLAISYHAFLPEPQADAAFSAKQPIWENNHM